MRLEFDEFGQIVTLEPIVCPECGSSDIERYSYDLECRDCFNIFEKRLGECECGSNIFEILIDRNYRCTHCNRVYNREGDEIELKCSQCGSTEFNYLGQIDAFEQCFECKDCGKRYDADAPELHGMW